MSLIMRSRSLVKPQVLELFFGMLELFFGSVLIDFEEPGLEFIQNAFPLFKLPEGNELDMY